MKLGSIGTCCGCPPAGFLRVQAVPTACACYGTAPTYSVQIDAEGETTTESYPTFFGNPGLTFPKPGDGHTVDITVTISGGPSYWALPGPITYSLASPYNEPGTDLGDGGEWLNATYTPAIPLAAGWTCCTIWSNPGVTINALHVVPSTVYLTTPRGSPTLTIDPDGGGQLALGTGFTGCWHEGTESDATYRYDYLLYYTTGGGSGIYGGPAGWRLRITVVRLSDSVVMETAVATFTDDDTDCGSSGWTADFSVSGTTHCNGAYEVSG
jgi:hypothetical protein